MASISRVTKQNRYSSAFGPEIDELPPEAASPDSDDDGIAFAVLVMMSPFDSYLSP